MVEAEAVLLVEAEAAAVAAAVFSEAEVVDEAAEVVVLVVSLGEALLEIPGTVAVSLGSEEELGVCFPLEWAEVAYLEAEDDLVVEDPGVPAVGVAVVH